MTERLLTEMAYDEMQVLLDNYIERSSQQTGEMPADSFLELLFAKLSQRIKNTLEIEGKIVNGQLVFSIPRVSGADLYVQDNQIVIGEQRIVVKLAI